jgi:hypothetical protein
VTVAVLWSKTDVMLRVVVAADVIVSPGSVIVDFTVFVDVVCEVKVTVDAFRVVVFPVVFSTTTVVVEVEPGTVVVLYFVVPATTVTVEVEAFRVLTLPVVLVARTSVVTVVPGRVTVDVLTTVV